MLRDRGNGLLVAGSRIPAAALDTPLRFASKRPGGVARPPLSDCRQGDDVSRERDPLRSPLLLPAGHVGRVLRHRPPTKARHAAHPNPPCGPLAIPLSVSPVPPTGSAPPLTRRAAVRSLVLIARLGRKGREQARGVIERTE